MPANSSNNSFAPIYNRRQRWRILLWTLLITSLLAAFMFLWMLPWLKAFLPTAHCQTVMGINGLILIMGLMFVASPLLLAMFLVVTEGPKSWRVYQLKQTPLPGEKVMKPTRYRYGSKALRRPLGFVVSIAILLIISTWSYVVINNMSDRIAENKKDCPTAQSLSIS